MAKEKNKNNITNETVKTALIELLQKIIRENSFITMADVMEGYTAPQYIIVENENEIKPICLATLLAVVVDDHLCKFITVYDGKTISTNTLSYIETCLPDCFFKISRNTIINIHHIQTVLSKEHTVIMKGTKLEFHCSEEKLPKLRQYLRQNNIIIKEK